MSQLADLNWMVNQPDVLRAMAPHWDRVDMRAFFLRPGNVMLGDVAGAALFGYLGNDRYEGHYLFPQATRPKHVIGRCRDFISTMFTEYGAQAIEGHVPVEQRASRALTRALGFTPLGPFVSPSGRSCVKYVLERSAWVISSAEFSAASAPSSAQGCRPALPTRPPSRPSLATTT